MRKTLLTISVEMVSLMLSAIAAASGQMATTGTGIVKTHNAAAHSMDVVASTANDLTAADASIAYAASYTDTSACGIGCDG